MSRNRALSLILLLLVPLSFSAPYGRSPDDIKGPWKGSLKIAGVELNIRVVFTQGTDGLEAKIDIPQQGAKDLPLQNVSYTEGRAHFELSAGPGLAVFDGNLEGDVISGEFTQSGVKGSFEVTRASEQDEQAAEAPVPPPYIEEEVAFRNGEIQLTGTLTRPDAAGRHPAVVLISGSGPQNRDEEIAGYKPFALIADGLTREGIAVLRYDDRGVGGSSGNTMLSTSDDFAGDVEAAVNMLRSRSDIDSESIGLFGHSEGALVAGLVASRSDVSFIVLAAGPAVKGDILIREQAILLAKASGATNEQIEQMLESQKNLFAVVRSGEGWEELEAGATEKALAAVRASGKGVEDPEAFVAAMVKAELGMARTPWYRHYLDYDPLPALQKISCPVLALFGSLDLQVPGSVNEPALRAALEAGGNRALTVKTYDGANHLFQDATTGLPAEYAFLEKELTAGFVSDIHEWITMNLSPKE